MRNVLIFACLAGLAAAISIYFIGEDAITADDNDYITDADIEAYDLKENSGYAV